MLHTLCCYSVTQDWPRDPGKKRGKPGEMQKAGYKPSALILSNVLLPLRCPSNSIFRLKSRLTADRLQSLPLSIRFGRECACGNETWTWKRLVRSSIGSYRAVLTDSIEGPLHTDMFRPAEAGRLLLATGGLFFEAGL